MAPIHNDTWESILEHEARRDHVPILREKERDLLIRAARAVRPKRILEIGTAIGYSALLLGKAFPDAEIDTVEIDKKRWSRAEEAVHALGWRERVHCRLGDAGEVIPTLEGDYDFLFLDGPKGQYLRHLCLAESLLADKAVIAADNVLFHGWVRSREAIPHKIRTSVMRLRAYIAYVETKYDTHIYEEGDGLAVSRKGWT